MSQAHSTSANRPYGLARVCRVWDVARSSVYDAMKRRELSDNGELPRPAKRGPTGACTDEELLRYIQRVLADSPWVGEGHRKVWARLRFQGIRTARRRVLRVMRENGLLAPQRAGTPHGSKAHDGTIIPDAPNEMWGTDMTGTLTGEGQASIFILIDHHTTECLGIHAARHGTRFEALEPVRQAVRGRFGEFAPGVADGVAVRHDHGSQFISHTYQDELRLLGMKSSPAYVREPETNGCAERFIRTLKEQLLWLHRFDTVEELNRALKEFQERYNREWLIERHGWISPSAKYAEALAQGCAA